MTHGDPLSSLSGYPLLDALRQRRTRRFGMGMEMKSGPMTFKSSRAPVRLSEEEEALLAFAACGITGPAVADLDFTPDGGGSILAGLTGRTVPSGDAIQMVSVFVINEDATYLLRGPRDFTPDELRELIELTQRGAFTEAFRKSRVVVKQGRVAPRLDPLYNLSVNRWSLYDPAGTYFLPVNELTLLYINGVLEIFGEQTGAFVVDERASFQPAGLRRFARSRGGHLRDDPGDGVVLTIQQLEGLVTEFATIEQGMVVQNLGLMTQAMGLGGFPHWAAHPYGWLEALGFTMQSMPSSRYLGMGRVLRTAARAFGQNVPVPLALGLERDGTPLLQSYRPPYFATMGDAVRAIVDLKFGATGVFRTGVRHASWREPGDIAEAACAPADAAIDATIAYCEYVYNRYGRFPAYALPFRTVLGYQASHVDADFYDKFYTPGVLSETQRQHMETWHRS